MKHQAHGSRLFFSLSFAAILLSILGLEAPARAEHTRVTNPNSLNAEIFGRGMRFGLGYDRVINDDLAVGFTVGSVGLNTDTSAELDTGQTATLATPYVNYYFQQDQGSVFVTGGAALVTNYSSTAFEGTKTALGGLRLNNVVPQFGVGYENRGDSGFLFRMAFYGMLGKNIVPWVGFTIGYAF